MPRHCSNPLPLDAMFLKKIFSPTNNLLPADGDTLLEIDNACLSYGQRHVLCHLHRTVKSADFIVLTGANGGGKTTLLRLMAGLLPPTAGSIRRREGLAVGYLPQYRHIDRRFPTTVRETVLSGCFGTGCLGGSLTAAHRSETDRLLQIFHLSDLASRPIAELSGGQWQRTLIARALAGQSDLLLLDEPDTHLDTLMKARFIDELKLRRATTAIVMVSHDEALLSAFGDVQEWHVGEGGVS